MLHTFLTTVVKVPKQLRQEIAEELHISSSSIDKVTIYIAETEDSDAGRQLASVFKLRVHEQLTKPQGGSIFTLGDNVVKLYSTRNTAVKGAIRANKVHEALAFLTSGLVSPCAEPGWRLPPLLHSGHHASRGGLHDIPGYNPGYD